MNYYIKRNDQKYGPYSLADLQRYLGSGDILPTDLAQSEGMQDWVPVSQIVGNVQASTPPAGEPAPQSYGQVPAYTTPAYTAPVMPGAPAMAMQYPAPPNIHWAVLLLLAVVTCGIFSTVWMFIEAAYVAKIDRENKAVMMYAIGIPCVILGSVFRGIRGFGGMTGLGGLVYLGGVILIIVGHFKIKASLEQHFNREEPVNLRLSGAMTFFFNVIYFQYHFNRINNWRRTGILA